MNNWGRYIGAIVGYFLGLMLYVNELFGAIVGFIVGMIFEQLAQKIKKPTFTKLTAEDLERIRSGFFSATFTVMGFLAHVAPNKRGDINQVAIRVMDRIGVPDHRRRAALDYFEDGQAGDFALHSAVSSFYRTHSDKPHLLEMFLELQLYAMYSKGRFSREERDTLLGIAYQMDLTEDDFLRLEKMIKAEFDYSKSRGGNKGWFGSKRRVGLKDAYTVLRTSPDATDDEVKQAYRRLTSQNHPDKLAAMGMTAEVLRGAEDKTREIRNAYEVIKDVRNF